MYILTRNSAGKLSGANWLYLPFVLGCVWRKRIPDVSNSTQFIQIRLSHLNFVLLAVIILSGLFAISIGLF